jgi:hypothetical protein
MPCFVSTFISDKFVASRRGLKWVVVIFFAPEYARHLAVQEKSDVDGVVLGYGSAEDEE